MPLTVGQQQKMLIETLEEKGASLIGFSDLSTINSKLTKIFPIAVSLVVKYDEKIVENLHTNESAFFEHDVVLHTHMEGLIQITENLLSELGYECVTIPINILIKDNKQLQELQTFPHKTAATCAGLGWIGKSALLITPEYGPRVKLGTVLTNARFEVGEPILRDRCGKCNLCVEACPYGAIHNVNWRQGIEREALFDAYLCNQMRLNFIPILGRKHECALCLQVCIVGRYLNSSENST